MQNLPLACRFWFNVLGLAAASGLFTSAHAATFTYTPTSPSTSVTDNWAGGIGWTAEPVSGFDTTLVFGSTSATPPTFFTTAGVVSNSVNNLPPASLDANGRFQLNNLTVGFNGLVATTGTAPQINITGGPLQFLANGAASPVLALRANGNTGAAATKVILTIANDLYVGAPAFTITSDSNQIGGSASGNVLLTGGFNFSTTGTHSLTFGGSGVPGNLLAGRTVFAGNIADSAGGAGNATTLTKTGTSFWDLNGAVTITGSTTVNGGTIRTSQATGLGTGDITVANGAQVWLNGGGTYTNNFFLAGIGPSTSLGGVGANAGALQIVGGTTTGLITLLGDTRITTTNGSSTSTPVTTIASRITGGFALTYGNAVGVQQSPLVIAGLLSDYTGGTTFLGENRTLGGANSGSTQTFRLGASEVIPNGISKGDVLMSFGDQAVQTLDLNGFSETINGLNSAGNGGNTKRVIQNGAASSTSVLTLGDNNANGSFLGTMKNGVATGVLSLTKIGTGTQTLSGTSTYTGPTTINGGTLLIDYNAFATTQASAPSNYFTTTSALVLSGGGTFAVSGRHDGAATAQPGLGAINQRTITGINATNLAVGQLVDGAGSAGVPAGAYILRIESPTSVSISANVTVANPTIVTSATSGTTSQSLQSLTLSGLAGSTSTLDFGTLGSVTLNIGAPPVQINDGSLLSIANWSSGSDHLIFTGIPTDFTSVFNQSEVSFLGFGTGYSIINNLGTYEVTAVPEPGTLALLALGAIGLLARRRRIC